MERPLPGKITLATLGACEMERFPEVPLDLQRLYPKMKAGRKLDRLDLKHVPPSPRLRFLVRTPSSVGSEELVSGLRISLGGKSRSSDYSRLVDRFSVRHAFAMEASGRAWWTVEFTVGLASVTAFTGLDAEGLDRLAKEFLGVVGIDGAEADIPRPDLVRPLQEKIPGCTVGRASAPPDNFWSQKLVRLMDDQEQRLVPENGRSIRIGLIDTGWTDHPELDIATVLDRSASTSVIDAGGGEDPMSSGTSHGTATGSLISSAHRAGDRGDRVAGIAPEATIVSVRALDFVVILPVGVTDPLLGGIAAVYLPSDILSGVRVCLEQGCQVLSMSFGGLMSEAVRDAIREAYARDVILCSAVGNCVGFVVEPASMPEVIACAAVGLDPATGAPRPWQGTSRGPLVDISAPGENVYIADWEQGQSVVRPGEGTSFAVPHLAAAAALWLERHGPSNLRSRYSGVAPLGEIYRTVVRSSAFVPQNWDRSNFGAGILNIPGLLDAVLPDKPESRDVPPGGSLCALAEGLLGGMLSEERIPVIGDVVQARVAINRIEVRDDGEAFGGAEPWLLAVFLRLDGRRMEADLTLDITELATGGTVSATLRFRRKDFDVSMVRTVSRGRHGNLPEADIDALRYNTEGAVVLNVPRAIGRWDTSVRPIPVRVLVKNGANLVGRDVVGLPGFVGAVTLLMEEDFFSDDMVRSLRDALAMQVSRALERALAELRVEVSVSDLGVSLPQVDLESIALGVEDRVRQAVARDASWWDLFLAGVDGDDILVRDTTLVNVLQIGAGVPIAPAEYSGEHGRWLMRGMVTLR